MKTITELQDYQNLAQRTAGTNEDVNSDVLEKRLCLIEGYEKLIFLLVSLHKAAVVGDDATRLKSLLFYGKDKGKGFDADNEIISSVYSPFNNKDSVKRLLSLNPKILHALLGLVSEAGEFTAHILEHIATGSPLDVDHLTKELGDSSWFVVEGAVGIGTTLQNVTEVNIDKLLKRFPGKFNSEDAVARKDEQ